LPRRPASRVCAGVGKTMNTSLTPERKAHNSLLLLPWCGICGMSRRRWLPFLLLLLLCCRYIVCCCRCRPSHGEYRRSSIRRRRRLSPRPPHRHMSNYDPPRRQHRPRTWWWWSTTRSGASTSATSPTHSGLLSAAGWVLDLLRGLLDWYSGYILTSLVARRAQPRQASGACLSTTL
jgi:hypothetical protein